MRRVLSLSRSWKLLLALTLTASAFGLVSAVQAAIPDSNGVIHSCVLPGTRRGREDPRVLSAQQGRRDRRATPARLARQDRRVRPGRRGQPDRRGYPERRGQRGRLDPATHGTSAAIPPPRR